MFLRKLVFLLFLLIILISCDQSVSGGGIEGTDICEYSDISVDNSAGILWKGNYTDTTIKISNTKLIGDDGETETLTFEFYKLGNCLRINHGYKYYYGASFDVSAITKMTILNVKMQNWVVDKNFAGELTYQDHHDKQIYNVTFNVDFTEDDYETEDANYTYFDDCIGDKLPINIDLDKDGTADFILGYEEERNKGNIPNFTAYTIKLSSTKDDDSNLILSPKKQNSPYFILFTPPFSSENTIRYKSDVKNTLEVFYEFDAPYQNYNYFLDNKLTYSEELKDDKDDYFLIRMTISDTHYYGWIKFQLKTTSCTIAILDTYLHDVEQEHIYVN